MAKAFANEEVMEEYLSGLLQESETQEQVRRESLNRLLEGAKPTIPDTLETEKSKASLPAQESLPEADNQVPPPPVGTESYVQASEFQALFFKVAGLTLAVPLTELGGIHQIDKIGPLFGKPDWFMGVMLHREEKLNVVDSAKWVMPEKYSEKLAESLNYQYLIMLDESGWGLACESLVTTASLQPDEVKWREGNSKRPWLAGTVKDKMCALLDVEQIIQMLEQGLASNQ